MRAIQLTCPRQFERIELDEPSSPGAGQALVRTVRMGVCGTDVSGYLGKMPFFGYPRIIGHELGVEVVEVGPGVESVRPGDRCSVEPYMHCGDCHACRRGASNCCARLEVIGVMVDGGLRERFLVRADKLHVSSSLDWEQLALVETLAIGCHAVHRGACTADDEVLIVGAGPIGLSVLEFVKLAGAPVTVLDLSPSRLEFCRSRLGVARTVQAGGSAGGPAPGVAELAERLRELSGGRLPDVVFDATGSARSMANSFEFLASLGRLVYVGITTEPISFTHPPFHKKEGTLLCSRNALPSDFRSIIRQIEQGRIDTRPWITHRASMDEMIDRFADFTDPEAGVVKAMIEVGEA